MNQSEFRQTFSYDEYIKFLNALEMEQIFVSMLTHHDNPKDFMYILYDRISVYHISFLCN